MAKSKTPEGEKVVRVVAIKLTDAEKAKKADLLAELQIERVSIEEEKKLAVSGFAERIKRIKVSLNKLSQEVHGGTEERSVECTMVKNYDANMIEWWLDDQIVEQREMTTEDRQLDLEPTSYEDQAQPKKSRKKKSEAELSVVQSEDEEVRDVIREETSKKTKRSSVDGAYELN